MKRTTLLLFGALCTLLLTTTAAAQEGKVVVRNGMKYLDVPYVAHTLEADGPERVVINRREVDCTTLVEYVLAETLAARQLADSTAAGGFAGCLRRIRYRDGKVDGYASRLHYTADWIENGLRNGFLCDVTAANTSHTQRLSLSYMSSHPEKYRKLKENPEQVTKMKAIEQALSGRVVHYLPKEELPAAGLPWMEEGDIIAITTSVPGLDVAHMGIAFRAGGQLRLLHASSTEKRVVASDTPLSQLLEQHQKWTGIRVLRLRR